MKIENRYYYAIKKPTQEKINELACEIARAEGMHSKIIFTLIRWPSWVSPPSWDLLEPYCHLVIEFREKAKAQLMKEWAEQPRLRIKRYKKIKLRNRKRYWTRRPTKYGQSPPPRRQGYIPPIDERVEIQERQEAQTEESSTKRPSRRDWRELLFETYGEPETPDMKGSPPKTLSDNRIEFTTPGFPLCGAYSNSAPQPPPQPLADGFRKLVAAILLGRRVASLCVLPPAKHEAPSFRRKTAAPSFPPALRSGRANASADTC